MTRRRKLLLLVLLGVTCVLFMYYSNWTASQTELLRTANFVKMAPTVRLTNSYSTFPDRNPQDNSSHLEIPANASLYSTSMELQQESLSDNITTASKEKHVHASSTEFQKDVPAKNTKIVDNGKITKPVQVIIVTKMRSGSSFAGEIFNRNDDFVYYFEPLNEMKVDEKDTTAGFAGTSYQSVLKGILNCDFSNFKGFTWWNGRRPNQQCIQSRAYQPSSLCAANAGKFQPVKVAMTESQKNGLNDETCKSRPNIAIKTVRISDIGHLKDLVENPSLNVKIVHLVRDPRAVSNSRQDIHDPDDPTRACQNIDDNLQKYWINPPDWIRGRYMLLRYEDLAEKPQYTVDKVYEFLLNTPAPPSVQKWLEQNTKHDASTGRKQDMKWSHTKDSAKTAHAWRTKLLIKFDKLLEAQRGCEKVMRLLGYKPVTSGAQMRDLKYSTLERYSYPLLPNRTTI